MSTDNYIELLLAVLLGGSLLQHISVHLKLRQLTKQHTDMATFQDLENSAAGLTTAVTALQIAITAYTTANTGAISATQADTIAAAINTASETLTTIATGLTPAAPAEPTPAA